MSQNWLRHFELRLFDKEGGGISLSDFKVVFDIQKMPNTSFASSVGNFKIYNLSTYTVNSIMGQEYTRVEVIAGYDGVPQKENATEEEAEVIANNASYGVIFSGDIRFTVTGKDNPTDTWIMLQCIEGWEGHLSAATITTLAAGWTYKDLFATTMKTYEPYGITAGATPNMPDTVFPRGRPIFQNSPAVINHIAGQCNADWWYENGQIVMRPENKYLEDELVELSANTGLIGMPQQTIGAGVNVRCLINPNIRLGGLVRINQKSVYRTVLSNEEIGSAPGAIGTTENNGNISTTGTLSQPASINTDGDYIVGSIDFHGDTRGQPWYMDLMCIAKGSADLMSSAAMSKTAI
ncbi:baseplate hub protein [Leminorella grimontii]|uniref:baseplate hub protein n=1 Tax=Leminorella grimontii TaxID=82981 RepID=UPI00321FA209